ncbi:MAG: allophanate hydrolase [Elusimicrobia bacterium CG08_land_8_20_14_0_20_59_10]|nr:MAG: allophanate hydrolase [Elusimicrobia bacterium CG08_land_8_20_14_0_20_59_10]
MPSAKQTETFFLGDSCLCWAFGDKIQQSASLRVLYVFRKLINNPELARLGVRDLVPSYTALAAHAGPACDWKVVRRVIDACIAEIPADEAGLRERSVRHILPVVYDGEDIQRVAGHAKITADEVIRRHTAPEYLVAMIGFRPHFPYLLGLDPSLVTPRLDSPRTAVPAGAVAIGGEQTGVYPETSPGGWNILGMTKPELLYGIEPGDTVVFRKAEE